MADLFSPLFIGGRELPNRIVMAPMPSGAATADGFVNDVVTDFYWRRARGGVGLVLTEALRVTAPPATTRSPHLGIYADAFVPGLRRLANAARAHGGRIMFTLADPAPPPPDTPLAALTEAFVTAIWRSHCAGADGVMLSAADGGAFYSLLSPRHNQRSDAYGKAGDGGQRLAVEVIETARRWMGNRLLFAFRLLADEFTPGGLTLQDARVLAKRLTAAGVRLLDVTVPAAPPNVARFPGWAVPLASSIRRVVDVPVIGSGDLGDPLLADSVVRDGSVDLIMLDGSLRRDPDWPLRAREAIDRAQ